ncbi:hypothetical protein [uncultured Corynebacterium sp.]|uniref:hypothetical protein n=1 Tax=uncultured Corynebacterium sp. TaxID=159447 RepID=UPI0025E6BC83|nr:hypothetical protein [uncultured Corynebacterium sp.]
MFALILGLALLGLAVWLLLRAKNNDAAGADGADGYDGGRGYSEYRGDSADWSGADDDADWGEDDWDEDSEGAPGSDAEGYPEDEEWPADEDGEWSEADDEEWFAAWEGPQFDSWSGDEDEYGDEHGYEDEPDEYTAGYPAENADADLGESSAEGWAEDWAEEPSEDWSEAESAAGENPVSPAPTAASAPASAMAAFGFPRRRRRQWATDNGFEYTKEDGEVARDWPIALLGDQRRGVPTLREVVSGFVDGHQVHIGDVGSSTLMAMRRVEASPVQVLYSADGTQPAGMRRTDLLDQPPFAAYTTDVRALDRMLDARVEDSLAALSQVARDVAWGQNWTVVRISRKLDFHVWQEILPRLRSLVDAAMVLPPAQTSAPLEMFTADQLRPLPGGPLQVNTADPVNQEEIEEQAAETSSRRAAHLRAVPDGAADDAGDAAGAGAEGSDATSSTAAGFNPVQGNTASTEEAAAHAEVPNPERPDITRPAEPVTFPSRTHTRWEGGDPDSFNSFAVGDYDDPAEDDDLHAGRRRRRDGGIPRLGEDPEHMSSHNSQYAQVIRVEAEEATIFEEFEETKSTAVRLSPVTQRRRSGGRHRAPEARHARPEPIEPIEYETVDGEVVEDDQQ